MLVIMLLFKYENALLVYLEGNSSDKILENLGSLETNMLESSICLIPIVHCLKDFQNVKIVIFLTNYNLSSKKQKKSKEFISFSIRVKICSKIRFKKNNNMEIPHSSVLCTNVENHNQGFDNFAELCRESIHAKFKPT